MSAVVRPIPNSPALDARLPFVVVGAGPVGIRVTNSLLQRDPECRVVLYGDEPWEPYNRVRLSSLLVGEVSQAEISNPLNLSNADRVEHHTACPIVGIDRWLNTVHDAEGRSQRYAALVLATGSKPHIPNIPGIDTPGVFTFRDLTDAQKLVARRVRSRHTVVLGGGLLGLEAARAMQRLNTKVTVIEHANRLMPAQLDENAGELLREHLLSLGIQVRLQDPVREVISDVSVSGVRLMSGTLINCDTIIVSAGIRPNIALAREARLNIGRGIRVNDAMQTSDPFVYAVGECAEHRDMVYGLVAPGYEQAEVAAHSILRGRASYSGSILATRLKVVNKPIFSMGRVADAENTIDHRFSTFSRSETGEYRKLVVERGRLVGAVAIGECPQLGRLQETIDRKRRVWPWQLRRFQYTGTLWPDQEAKSVVDWPASTTVCNCNAVSRGQLSKAVAQGADTVEKLMACTNASTVCGSCRPLLSQIIGADVAVERAKGTQTLLWASIAVLATGLAAMVGFSVPYAETVDVLLQWDALWRSSLAKQISGFSLLGLGITLSVLSLRKRWRKLTWGDFPLWRLLHVVLGVITVAVIVLHTGLRIGENLNFALMVGFVGLIVTGAFVGVFFAGQHRLDPVTARRWRSVLSWGHMLFLWPVPVLLGFHVFKTYYF